MGMKITMDTIDIDKLEGEELDLLVAVEIMEWDHSHEIEECEDGWYSYCRNCGHEPRFSKIEKDCGTPPNYSGNIAAAWMVHKTTCKWKFSERHKYFAFLMQEVSAGTEYQIGWPSVLMFLEPVHFCRAALKTMRNS